MPSSPVVAVARSSATYAADGASVRQARGLVSSALVRWGLDHLADDATLLVSELVTNSVVHAGTDVEVAVALLDDCVEIAVTDRHPGKSLPAAPHPVAPDREHGRGLAVLAALTPMWGVDHTDRTKTVWFRVSLRGGGVPAARRGAAPVVGPDDAAPVVGVVRLDADGNVSAADDHAALLLGRGGPEVLGARWRSLCAPEDAGTLLVAAASPRWQGTYRLRRPDGIDVTVLARHVQLVAAGGETTTLCVLVDHRFRALVGEMLGGPRTGPGGDGPFTSNPEELLRLDLDALLDRTLRWAREQLSAEGAHAMLVSHDGNELELRAAVGPGPGQALTPLPESPAPVLDDEPGHPSHVSVPVMAGGRLVGTVGVTSSAPRAFTVADATRLQRGVDTVALALSSARVAEIERRRHGWLGYLAEASDLLAGTLEPDMALALVAQLVSPRLGPWCAVYLTDDGGEPRAAIAWHSDEERIADLRALIDATGAPAPAPGQTLRWLPDPGAAPGAAADLASDGGYCVALVARGRVLGSLLLGHHASGRGSRDSLPLLRDLAPRAALALDNARLYAERTATSRALQHSLLPRELPDLPGLDVGVVYEATGAGNEVGGDFYDIFTVPDELPPDSHRFGFAVGDVCGKGPEAAAVTGLARTALRVLSRHGDDIPRALGNLNAAILAEGSGARFLTAVYGEGVVSGSGVSVRFACAGHPRPVLLRADGSVEQAGVTSDLLGVFDEPEITVSTVHLARGESLVCFTDGVTERRAGSRMLGEDGVLAAVRGGADLTAAALARRLGTVVREYAPEPARDDVAVLVLRAAPDPRPRRPPG